MGMLAPERIQLQLQLQQQQQQQSGQTPWLMDDNALLDLDMNVMDGDNSGEGQVPVGEDARANALGGVGIGGDSPTALYSAALFFP
ncbi:hypothetical protein sscle_06g054190 [Sclerotinia sclerotiorum 1980 UF-70]|uniref:Uncharacterized protein n=1 Tax=Sclerotinia sclerotiorum (strain ATCC 18683 / 1980 / Ss-1) TaxID=665079 RepID=A0A1D9Q6X6_SCLS1|nr:hypothetical protein sscle_06g054190 [Sclerotinia sclerotiorum 1980 UF-70]